MWVSFTWTVTLCSGAAWRYPCVTCSPEKLDIMLLCMHGMKDLWKIKAWRGENLKLIFSEGVGIGKQVCGNGKTSVFDMGSGVSWDWWTGGTQPWGLKHGSAARTLAVLSPDHEQKGKVIFPNNTLHVSLTEMMHFSGRSLLQFQLWITALDFL